MSVFVAMFLLAAVPLSSDVCDSVAACTLFVNHASGPAIESTSIAGNGIVGRTTASGNSNAVVAGVYGESLATSGGPLAGVFGFSNPKSDGFGVIGQGPVGLAGLGARYGVAGIAGRSSGKNAGVEGVGPAGVVGLGQGPDPGVFGLGEGSGSENYGVEGISSLAGVHGQGQIGVIATSLGSAALQLEPENSALAFVSIGPAGSPTATLDSSGDLDLSGKITAQGASFSIASTPAGARYTAYGDRSAQPLIEDVGEAQLTGGVAAVPLERRFAALIDFSQPYMVFVTPEGDSNGLYVSRRTSTGFVVRENRGGASSLGFQYRIVAAPADTQGGRLPAATGQPKLSGSSRHVTNPTFDVPKFPRTF